MPADTKTALLDFADHAVRTRGFDGFSYADLAEAVGIRKASIHYHFPSKAHLSEVLMERYYKTFEQACAEIDETHNSAAERLSALIALYRAALHQGQTLCLCVAFIGSRESLSDGLKAKIAAFRAMVVKWLTATFEQGQRDGSIAHVTRAENEARTALALLEGAHLAARADESAATFDQALALLKARLILPPPGCGAPNSP